MGYPSDRKYTKSHEWVQAQGDQATVGITHFAQDKLGDVVFVELPKVGATLKAGQPFGVVESTKAASEVYSPVSGQVTAVNSPLVDQTSLLNSDPHGGAWMIKVKLSNESELSGLLDSAAYETHAASDGH